MELQLGKIGLQQALGKFRTVAEPAAGFLQGFACIFPLGDQIIPGGFQMAAQFGFRFQLQFRIVAQDVGAFGEFRFDRIVFHDGLLDHSDPSSRFSAEQNVRLSFTFSATCSFPVLVKA